MVQQLDLFSMFAEPENVAENELDAKENAVVEALIEAIENTAITEVDKENILEAKAENDEVPISSSISGTSQHIEEEPLVYQEPSILHNSAPNLFPKESIPAQTKAKSTKALKSIAATAEKNVLLNPLKKRGRKSFKDMDAEVDLIEVPDEETLKRKLYYSIGEVAGFFKVNSSLIRAWEIEFDILQPRKNRKGDRLFRVEDIKNLQMIYYLLRNRKFSIDGAKKYIKSNKKGADTNYQLTQSLKKFRSFLLELKSNLVA